MSGRCALAPASCVCANDPPGVRARCVQWREEDPTRPVGIFANSKEERRRRTALQPDCARCRNKAPQGSPYCAACAPIVEREREAADLTDEFHRIASAAEAAADPYADTSPREVADLVARLARAMAQARETK